MYWLALIARWVYLPLNVRKYLTIAFYELQGKKIKA